ncbi:MAG TPA: hypothetical protein PK078_13905 [Anaerolineales bacterium]|nr:hypothetical protein [Anaerolineales bacterium]HNB35096.1 hypothetical protein [Anaerolineales bacterium]
MFRRARRLFRGGPPPVPPLLRQAHRMMEAGDFNNAAIAFHDLAKKAEDFAPERSPALYAEAGRASLLGGDPKKAVAHFRSALTLLGSQQRFHRMERLGQRIIHELREHGRNAEADEIAQVLKNNVPQTKDNEPTAISTPKPILPTHCPSCGAAVRPDEVDWLDEMTAECDYCGSPVRAE